MTDDPPVDDQTLVIPPIQQFRNALPAHISMRLATNAAEITALRAALDRGWTIATLVAYCLEQIGRGAQRPAAIVHYHLMQAAKIDPPKAARTRPRAHGLAECSHCGKPTGTKTATGAAMCPTCLLAGPPGKRAGPPPAEAKALIDKIRNRKKELKP